MKMAAEIKVISDLREYVLDRAELARYCRMVPCSAGDPEWDEETRPEVRHPRPRDNFPQFKDDLVSGRLRGYEDTYVAYSSGILCGQSANKKYLYRKAAGIHGYENIAVFKVHGGLDISERFNLTNDSIQSLKELEDMAGESDPCQNCAERLSGVGGEQCKDCKSKED